MVFPPLYLVSRFWQSDTLVLLSRDYSKKDGWHGRHQLVLEGSRRTLSIPTAQSFEQPISEIKLFRPDFYRSKLVKTLRQNYGKSPWLSLGLDLSEISTESYSTFCWVFLHRLKELLGFGPEIIDETRLNLVRSKNASEWLSSIGLAIDCKVYLCASDATEKYLDSSFFLSKKIELKAQNWQPTSPSIQPQDSILHGLLALGPVELGACLKS